jgi:hypothetical protein
MICMAGRRRFTSSGPAPKEAVARRSPTDVATPPESTPIGINTIGAATPLTTDEPS